ncbi:hypothetical protein SAMN05444581_12324 [Methylocapsa palsarum]|uniref:Uncharacterized protein n=1 Tax=Methylocapsa palsarum TaxID=1612308 RepID=A0A1I4CIQ9_9HYPH|nr:hypothetical protein SAMN05444581_12324 [Methylocapsa palsarum]
MTRQNSQLSLFDGTFLKGSGALTLGGGVDKPVVFEPDADDDDAGPKHPDRTIPNRPRLIFVARGIALLRTAGRRAPGTISRPSVCRS